MMRYKRATKLGFFIFLILLISGGAILSLYTKDTKFIIDETTKELIIDDRSYDQTIHIDETLIINLVDPIDIKSKEDGLSLGSIKAGYFVLEGDITAYLNLNRYKDQWIEIIDGDNYFYINKKDRLETFDLYTELLLLQDKL